ncbi:unnamed protein product [Blepharisma stoltei]|uniref:Uncharacterized protein n=1 Tax=Blepharisma stoltei TaxID=1481888 RepID=A0AAU9K9S3_9CILI|nr:unnamed protein product [Blepharisma stoltei]
MDKKINEFIGDKAVSFSQSGHYLATLYHNAIYVWNFDPNLRYIEGHYHKEPIYSISLSSSNKYLASAGEGETIKIWDIKSLKLISEHKIHKNFVSSVCFSPNEDLLLSGSADLTVKLYDIKERSVISTFYGHEQSLRSVKFVPFGKYIASVDNDDFAIIWKIKDQKIYKTFEDVYDIAFHPNLYVFALSCKSGVRIISTDNWEEKKKLTVDYPKRVIFSPLGNVFATINFNKEISLWSTKNFNELSSFLDGGVLAFSPCENYLAAAHKSNIVLYDIGKITSISYSSDGKFICSGSKDKTIKLWDAEKGLESLRQKIKEGVVANQSFLKWTSTSDDLIMPFCSFSREKLNLQTLNLMDSLCPNP